MALGLVTALAATGCGGASGAPPAKPQGKTPNAWAYGYAAKDLNSSGVNVAAVSADDAWAITVQPVTGQIDNQTMTLLRYDGTSFRPQKPPPGIETSKGGSYRLEASSPDDVWLFQSRTGTGLYVAHWNGTRWKQVAAPDGITGVSDVAVLGPDDTWVANGTDTVGHWDGARWTVMSLPAPVEFLAAEPGGDVWASGRTEDAEDRLVYGGPVVLRRDGETWKRERLPAVVPPAGQSALLGVSPMALYAPAPDDVWAISRLAGEDENGDAVYLEPFALHWDGTRWSKASPEDCGPCGVPAGDATLTAHGMHGDNGDGDTVLFSARHRPAHGTPRKIGRPPYTAGHSGKVTASDRKQKLRLREITSIPGTSEVWGIGSITLEAHGDANFSRAVILRYDADAAK
ncbi:hypothetical protein [Streptomyces longisporoflavus]|uniref:Lipoprotein n=1 Tax=Streptomyces longisporoflavus TaxID=28044 RepID=A0ABW7R1H9_9ACTN